MKVLVEKQLSFTPGVLGGFTDETYKEEVLSYIKNNSLERHVSFYGWVLQQKLQAVLAQSDILMVSSKQESLPMVIAEAISAGKVVVSSNVDGIPKMITYGEDGFVFNISAVENVLPILEQLHNNITRVQQITSKGKTKSHGYLSLRYSGTKNNRLLPVAAAIKKIARQYGF